MQYLISDALVWPGARRLLRQGKDVRIGGRAFDLLLALIERRDRVVSRDELYELVWPDVAIEPNNLAFQVWTLRRLLGAQAVATVARRGYQLAAPVRELPEDEPAATASGSSLTAGPLASGLGMLLLAHRLVTLVHACPNIRQQQARQAASQLASQLAGGVWWLPHCTPATERNRLLRRLAQQPALLVLEDGHLQPRATLAHVGAVLGAFAALRLLVTSLNPLGHPLERLTQAEPAQAEMSTSGALPRYLRWQSRWA